MENNLTEYKTADLIIRPELGLVNIDSHSIRLGPVNMKVLVELVKRQDQVVSRTKLFDLVWKNQSISDDTLTRCISDLRSKLGEHSTFKNLIVTIPKKGYQWNPTTTQKPIVETPEVDLKNLEPTSKPIHSLIYTILASILGIFILATSSLWLANYLIRQEHIPLLLIPIESNDKNQLLIAKKIEDSLRNNMHKTKNMRFLSSAIFLNTPEYSFINLSKQYGVNWAIEARVRSINDKNKIILSLVDARTGLELYSVSNDNDGQITQTELFVIKFIKDVEEKIYKN
jgi:DNA-binding winged helix-turn-helix (wHTH) protein/TolB-like protein